MPKRLNESVAMIRQEPFNYLATFNADNQVEYEGWSYPGKVEGDNDWQICKHTYTSGNLTKTEWANGANFNNIWTSRSTYFS
jgi:hypothetical protein